ncbi:MAG TPA: hypothetical protein VMD59_14975 [Acidimicrobiales bacterium]|nr:hypothetical protein [Acidimicrobiales bacterium]
MTRFADRLWSDLVREHSGALARADRAAPSRGRLDRRPFVLAGSTLGLAGLGTALALVLGAASSPPAYAVTTNGDGSVLVTIGQGSSLPQANAKLTAMGIHEQVVIDVASGPATVSGPVTCAPAAGASVVGPPLQVLLGSDGTEVISPSQASGATGVGTYHLDHCTVTSDAGSGRSGTTGGTGAG